MWVDILKKSLQGRAFREFIEKRMNLTVDYEEKSTHEDTGKTTGVSKTNTYVHTGGTNDRYMPHLRKLW